MIGPIPANDAPLRELIAFTDANSPVANLRDLWGPNYAERARFLWADFIETFRRDDPPEGSLDDLLFCLTYDVALGGINTMPLQTRQRFQNWLLDGIRSRS